MKIDKNMRVGALLTFFTLTIVIFVLTLDRAATIFGTRDTVYITFSQVNGLQPEDPVRFHGVPCGRVIEIQIVEVDGDSNIARAEDEEQDQDAIEEQESKVLVTAEVTSDVRKRLRENSVATIERTLTGATLIALLEGNGSPLLPDGILEGSSGTSITDVGDELLLAITALRRLADQLAPTVEVLNGPRGLNHLVDGFNQASDSLRELADETRLLVRDTGEPLLSSISEAELLFSDLRVRTETLPEAIDEAYRAARNGGQTLERIDDVVVRNRSSLNSATEDIASASRNLRDLSSELRHRPWRLLTPPGRHDGETIDLYETASQYAQGALELRRAVEMLEDVLARRGEDPRVLKEVENAVQGLGESIERQRSFEEIFLKRMDNLVND